MATPPSLVDQMLALATDELQSRWQARWETLQRNLPTPNNYDKCTVQESLEEAYFFDPEKKAELTKEELAKVAEVIGGLLRFEPSLRASPKDVLNSEWLHEQLQ